MKINNTQQKGLTSDTTPSLLRQQCQSNLLRESLFAQSEDQPRVALPSTDSLPNFGVKVNPLINAEAHDCFSKEGKTTYLNTHFDESMKYITSAPMLRAKTKTTCKRRGKCHHLRADTGKLRISVWGFFGHTWQQLGSRVPTAFWGPLGNLSPWSPPPDALMWPSPLAAGSNLSAGQQGSGQTLGSMALILPCPQQDPASPQLKSARSSGKGRQTFR